MQLQSAERPIPLGVKLPGVHNPQFLAAKAQYVGELIKCILSEFQRLEGVKPDQIEIKVEGNDAALNPLASLSEAGIDGGAVLVVTVAPSASGALLC